MATHRPDLEPIYQPHWPYPEGRAGPWTPPDAAPTTQIRDLQPDKPLSLRYSEVFLQYHFEICNIIASAFLLGSFRALLAPLPSLS